MEKLPRVKPWIIRDDDAPEVEPTGSSSRRPRSWTPTSSSACASTACSATPPARSTASTRTFIGPAAIALAERYDLDSRDHREPASGSTSSSSTTASGAARSSASARGCAPSTWIPRRRHPALQAEGGAGDGEGLPAPAGRAMTDADAPLPAPRLDLVVDPEADLLRLRDARAEQHLRRLVRGVPAAVRLRRRPAARRPTSASSTGPPRRGWSR